jgi:hypothetical protein
MDRYFPPPALDAEPPLATAEDHGRAIAGEYQLSARPVGDYQAALFLLQRYAIGLRIDLHDDGTISTPGLLAFEDGRAKRWREVAPYVWRQVDGRARLRADFRDGKVRGLWPDDLPSVYVMQPVSPIVAAGWNVPLLLFSSLTLVIALLAWPVAAIARRLLGAARPAPAGDRAARITFRAARALAVGFLLGWMAVVGADLGSRAGTDGWIRLLQVVGVAFVLAAAAATYQLWRTWRTDRSWRLRLGRTLTTLALLDLVWFSFVFGLLSLPLNY